METLFRWTDPETSRLAAERASKVRCVEIAVEIIVIMLQLDMPLSDSDLYANIVEAHGTKWTDRAVRHGRQALLESGYIEQASEPVRNRRGSLCRAWQLTEKGRTEAVE